MISEARWSKEETRAFPSAGYNDAEIRPAREFLFFLLGHLHLYPTQEANGFALLDEAAGDDASLVRQDGVAVCGADFEGAVWQVHVDVFAQVALEVFFLVRGSEAAQVLCDTRQAEQVAVRQGGVFVDDDIALEDLADGFFLDAARGVEVGFQLADLGPEVDLWNDMCELLRLDKAQLKGREEMRRLTRSTRASVIRSS